MSMRYKGGVISATPPTTSSSSAVGVWTLEQQLQATAGTGWPSYPPYLISTLTSASGNNSRGIAFDSAGNFYVTGGDPSVYLYLQKYNISGVLQWQKQLQTSVTGHAVAVDSASNICVAFYYASGGGGVIKFDSSGATLWQKQLLPTNVGSDYAYGVDIDSSNNVYIAGATYTGTRWYQIVAKYNSSGTLQWQRTLATTTNDAFAYSIKVSPAGNVYTTGYNTGSGTFDVQIAKYNTSGTLQWQRSLDTTSREVGTSITIDSSENIYIAGDGYSPAYCLFLVKFDTSGTLQWSRTLTSVTTKNGLGIAIDSSSNIYLTGCDAVAPGLQYVVKYNSSGTIQWQRSLTNLRINSLSYNNLAIDSNNVLYLTAQANIGGSGGANNSGVFYKLPSNGSKTGSYTVGAFSTTYAVGSLTEAAGTFTAATSSLTSATSTLTDSTTTFTSSNSSLTSTTSLI